MTELVYLVMAIKLLCLNQLMNKITCPQQFLVTGG